MEPTSPSLPTMDDFNIQKAATANKYPDNHSTFEYIWLQLYALFGEELTNEDNIRKSYPLPSLN